VKREHSLAKWFLLSIFSLIGVLHFFSLTAPQGTEQKKIATIEVSLLSQPSVPAEPTRALAQLPQKLSPSKGETKTLLAGKSSSSGTKIASLNSTTLKEKNAVESVQEKESTPLQNPQTLLSQFRIEEKKPMLLAGLDSNSSWKHSQQTLHSPPKNTTAENTFPRKNEAIRYAIAATTQEYGDPQGVQKLPLDSSQSTKKPQGIVILRF
jgi:hypothetical protein